MKEQLIKTLHHIVSLGVEFMHTKFRVPITFGFTNYYFVMVLPQELKLAVLYGSQEKNERVK